MEGKICQLGLSFQQQWLPDDKPTISRNVIKALIELRSFDVAVGVAYFSNGFYIIGDRQITKVIEKYVQR